MEVVTGTGQVTQTGATATKSRANPFVASFLRVINPPLNFFRDLFSSCFHRSRGYTTFPKESGEELVTRNSAGSASVNNTTETKKLTFQERFSKLQSQFKFDKDLNFITKLQNKLKSTLNGYKENFKKLEENFKKLEEKLDKSFSAETIPSIKKLIYSFSKIKHVRNDQKLKNYLGSLDKHTKQFQLNQKKIKLNQEMLLDLKKELLELKERLYEFQHIKYKQGLVVYEPYEEDWENHDQNDLQELKEERKNTLNKSKEELNELEKSYHNLIKNTENRINKIENNIQNLKDAIKKPEDSKDKTEDLSTEINNDIIKIQSRIDELKFSFPYSDSENQWKKLINLSNDINEFDSQKTWMK